jgi:dihydrofolate reductase
MRKIVAGLFVTVDGVVEAADQFTASYMGPEIGQELGAQSAQRDALLLGRQTYQEMSAYWPSQGTDSPMAAQMNETPKYVVSTSLHGVEEWQNSTLIKGDPVEELLALKQQPGKNIMSIGSATLVESLLRAGVVDELYMLVFPVVFGRGRRLFDSGGDSVPLTLTECHAFSNGVVKHVYVPTAL